jgi:hypothetical protein
MARMFGSIVKLSGREGVVMSDESRVKYSFMARNVRGVQFEDLRVGMRVQFADWCSPDARARAVSPLSKETSDV